jgi:hypothetical protein
LNFSQGSFGGFNEIGIFVLAGAFFAVSSVSEQTGHSSRTRNVDEFYT